MKSFVIPLINITHYIFKEETLVTINFSDFFLRKIVFGRNYPAGNCPCLELFWCEMSMARII